MDTHSPGPTFFHGRCQGGFSLPHYFIAPDLLASACVADLYIAVSTLFVIESPGHSRETEIMQVTKGYRLSELKHLTL
jgi:hypothetical protein